MLPNQIGIEFGLGEGVVEDVAIADSPENSMEGLIHVAIVQLPVNF